MADPQRRSRGKRQEEQRRRWRTGHSWKARREFDLTAHILLYGQPRNSPYPKGSSQTHPICVTIRDVYDPTTWLSRNESTITREKIVFSKYDVPIVVRLRSVNMNHVASTQINGLTKMRLTERLKNHRNDKVTKHFFSIFNKLMTQNHGALIYAIRAGITAAAGLLYRLLPTDTALFGGACVY